MNSHLPPLTPRPRRPDGELPPLAPRPTRGEGLPPIDRPPAPLPSRGPADATRRLTPIDGGQPTERLPAPPPNNRRGPRRVLLTSLLVLTAGGAGAVSAHVFGPERTPAASADNPTRPVAASDGSGGPRLQDAVRTAGPSVVEVRAGFGQGSGVIVEPQGLIITNYHVVRGQTRVEIRTASGASLPAEVVNTDEFQDLAVLRPAGDAGPGIPLVDASSGTPEIGAPVFAIGSPFGLQNTVTAGVVSAFRDDDGRPVIQFDAPVNPGNSGGGLFDLEGRLIGIPTSIKSPIPGNVGLGFAVPASRVREMLARVS